MNFLVIINGISSGLNFYAYVLTGGNLNLFFFLICGYVAVSSYRPK